MPKPERLNLLFVTLDQLRADAVSGRLAGLAPTPALDRLKREGTEFTQCYTAAVPCGPSRASLLTGLYGFNHRAMRNGAPLARHHATLGTELRRLGREPLLFGYNDITPDPTGRDRADPDFLTYELPAPGFREIVEMRSEAPLAWIGHLRRRGHALPPGLPARWLDLHRPVTPAGAAWTPADPLPWPAEDSETAFLTDRTLEALEARRETVWTAHVTYIKPHPPLCAPAPWNRIVDPAAVPPPVPAPETQPHPLRTAWFSGPSQAGLFWGFDGDVARLSSETVAGLRAVYLDLLAEVDHHLGRLLDWLDATGQTERTLVIVIADHGEMLGDQGFWGKDSVLAPAHRVPLILRGPGVAAGHSVVAPVSTVDVAPTILARLGGTPPPAMDGQLLTAALGGAEAGGSPALTELELGHPLRPTRFQTALGLDWTRANAAVLRDARWTLVHLNGGLPPMLFDRAADPDETRDLAAEPAAAAEIARLRTAMLDLRMTRADRRLIGHAFGA